MQTLLLNTARSSDSLVLRKIGSVCIVCAEGIRYSGRDAVVGMGGDAVTAIDAVDAVIAVRDEFSGSEVWLMLLESRGQLMMSSDHLRAETNFFRKWQSRPPEDWASNPQASTALGKHGGWAIISRYIMLSF